jgi:polyphosphate glucokinase
MKVLVIDIGGTNVKMLATGQELMRKVASGPMLTPREMVKAVTAAVKDWEYDAVSLGYPGPVRGGKPTAEPKNLGTGWTKFDFAKALDRPVRMLNDAAMQALGSYEGGRMLFLGLGTGLGSTLIVDGIIEPMELGHLPYRKHTYEDYIGQRGLERLGKSRWRRHVTEVVAQLIAALEPDDVVLGGGNVRQLGELPQGCRAGDNANAFIGGFRLWEHASNGKRAATRQRVPNTTTRQKEYINGNSNRSA